MKRFVLSLAFIFGFLQAQAKPLNLYEQLCEINQEWRKNRTIAEKLGFLNLPPIAGEQNILTFHIEILHKILRDRDISALSPTQQQARANSLRNLNEYAQLRDCPRNYYLPYRNPVFIDHEGRYCAVAYLMKKTGKQAFCEAVQQASNFIYIRQITNPEFHTWQHESGLSLDELAWIQPTYEPAVLFIEWDKRSSNGDLIVLDSLEGSKIYHFDFNFGEISEKDVIFNIWGLPYEIKELNKDLKYFNRAYAKTHKPDWVKIRDSTKDITAMNVIQNELYVVVDSSWTCNKSDSIEYKATHILYKWDKKKKWTKISQFDFQSEEDVRCIFEHEGKFYIAGGYETKAGYNEEGAYMRPLATSFLASFDGKQWEVSQEEFGGYIVGFVDVKGKHYLASMYNRLLTGRAPINQPKKTEASSKEGK